MNAADLAESAREAAERAYAPYSGFRVGSVVVADDGAVYSGSNVENAAFGSAICAEGVAISHAVASGARKIPTVAVACIDADSVDGAYPCGNCRQLARELGVERVLLTIDGTDVVEYTMEELLPHGFEL